MNAADRMTPRGLRLLGARSVAVRTSGGDMHVLEAPGTGDLPPILLLHGIGSCAADWGLLLSRLLPLTRRVILPDMPGHGQSPAPAGGMETGRLRQVMGELLEARVTEPTIVVGNSLGGAAAVQFAATSPERVRALVLVSPGGAPMTQAELDALLSQFHMRSQADAEQFVDRFLARPTWTRPLLAACVRARMHRGSIRELVRRISVDDLLTREDLAALAMPTLCLWGPDDGVLPAAHREFFRQHLPLHARFEEPRGYGHAPFLDQPADFVRRIEAFARESVRAGRRAA